MYTAMSLGSFGCRRDSNSKVLTHDGKRWYAQQLDDNLGAKPCCSKIQFEATYTAILKDCVRKGIPFHGYLIGNVEYL